MTNVLPTRDTTSETKDRLKDSRVIEEAISQFISRHRPRIREAISGRITVTIPKGGNEGQDFTSAIEFCVQPQGRESVNATNIPDVVIERPRDNVVVFRIFGDLSGADEQGIFDTVRSVKANLENAKKPTAILNFSEAKRECWDGVTPILLAAYRSIKESSGSLLVCQASENVQNILERGKLNHLCKSFDTEKDALDSIKQSRGSRPKRPIVV